MTVSELQRLALIGEGLHIEFKKRVPEPLRIAKELIALANTQGGKILIGVEDDGRLSGVRDAEEEMYALDLALRQHCEPAVEYQLELVPVQHRREVVVVHVPNSAKKPHFMVGSEADRRVAYIRIADKSVEASKEIVRLMRTEKQQQDVQFEFGAKERTLMEYLDRYERITVDQFARLANIPRKNASHTLVLLVKARILQVHPTENGDYYTLSIN